MREVGAHDLPLAAAFDEDQRCAAMHDPHLAIFRHPSKRVISIGNPSLVVKDPTGKLPKAESAGSQPTRRALEKIHKLLLVIKAIGDRVEDFQVLIQQLCYCATSTAGLSPWLKASAKAWAAASICCTLMVFPP